MSRTVGLAYVPVLHKGYLDFFAVLERNNVSELYLISDELLAPHQELDYIHRKDRLRAVPQHTIQLAIVNLTPFHVTLLQKENMVTLQNESIEIVAPNEDISRFIIGTYFPNAPVQYADIFLRWHKDNIGEDKEPTHVATVTASEFQKKLFMNLHTEASKSFDWWRQIGAALVAGEKILLMAHNEHMPETQLPNILGDTRALFKKGIHINYVTSAHAEAAVIGEAAKHGIVTDGAELYVTDFPCPYCARLIAKSGIKKVYFQNGYAVLEGDVFLKDAGIEIIKVEI